MDKGENSAESCKATTALGVKIKEEPQEETIKVGITVYLFLSGSLLAGILPIYDDFVASHS